MPYSVNPDHGYLERFETAASLGALTKINVDASTPPGTDPVIPDSNSEITMTAAQIGAGTTANAIRVYSDTVNTVTLQIQQSSTSSAKNADKNGIAHFNSAQFSIDEGFVSIIDSANTATGQTIGATTADIITITPTNNKSFTAQILVTGYESSVHGAIGGEIICVGYRNSDCYIVGSNIKSRNSSSHLAAGDISVVADGTNFIVRVLGVASYTINWTASLIYYQSQ